MKRPYLIQRLGKPYNTSPFSFGGGLISGGLSDDAMKMLDGIFSFDYMGAAEFEWGAVPTALQSIANLSINDKLSSTIIDDKIYIICPTDIMTDVVDWINLVKINKHESIKEYIGLKESIESDDNSNKGWLKIEGDKVCKEPFMFFVDKKMFEKTCQLFEL